MVDIIPLLDPNNTQPALKNLLGLGGTTYSPETEAAFFDISYIVTFGLSSLFSATLIGLISANIDKSRFAKHTSRK
ncbi:MAG: hypothetical protein K2M43_01135 [Mycoplasmoidaceae bacterium]|nr:hypothetical protein [Mycoplasmoidaceae bacterium]